MKKDTYIKKTRKSVNVDLNKTAEKDSGRIHIAGKVSISRRAYTALKFSFLFLLFFLLAYVKLDFDFGWHLQAGNYFREHGMPAHDIFSYTAQSFEWINHEWINDLFMSYMYDWGGYLLLSIFFAGVWTAAIFVIYSKAKWITLLLAFSALVPYAGIRPLAWSALFFAILLRLCISKSDKKKLFIPLVILLWANLHGGFILGLAVVGYFLLKRRNKLWIGILAASILASFANLYGPRVYTEVARTLFDPEIHRQVTEWHPVTIFWASTAYVALWATGFWVFERKDMSKWLSLPVLLFVASMSSSRHLVVFIIASLKGLDDYIGRFYTELLASDGKRKTEIIKNVITATFVALIVGWTICVNHALYIGGFDKETIYPKQAVEYIKVHGCSGRIFNHYDYGGYLIWKLPEYKVYIDGRMPSWRMENGQKYVDRFLEVIDNNKERTKEFKKYNIKCALVPANNGKVIDDLKAKHWVVKVNANGAVLLVSPK